VREGGTLEKSKPIKHKDVAFRFGALMEKRRAQTSSESILPALMGEEDRALKGPTWIEGGVAHGFMETR